jgi:hypothetical protein
LASKVINYLIENEHSSQAQVANYVNGMIEGVAHPTAEKAMSCAKSSVEAWRETASIRADPEFGVPTSALWVATRCVISFF